MQEACAFKLHNTFLVSVLLNTHGRGTIINLLKQYSLVFFVHRDLVSCNVAYVMEEKSNTDILYTVLSKHVIYEGFFG